MADAVSNGVRSISMQDPKQSPSHVESDVIMDVVDGVNGHTDPGNAFLATTGLTLEEGQGEGRDLTSPPSQGHGDSKYEFDPVSTGSSSAPLSPPETTDSSSGMFVDFDGVSRQLHEASTASVSPQSPPEGGAAAADPFSHDNKENSDPMTSSFYGGDPMTSSFYGGDAITSSTVGGDLMTSSFTGDFLPEPSQNDDINDLIHTGSTALPPGGPVSDAALQEIGVYGAPPPDEGGVSVPSPGGALACLDEDGMEMPTTMAPSAPPSNSSGLPSNAMHSNITSDSLITTHAPMGQFDPYKAEVNSSQSSSSAFDSIPGQPPIGFPPPLQPREAFVDPAPLVPDLAPAPVPAPRAAPAPGGPLMQEPLVIPSEAATVNSAPPPYGMPPKNEPLFTMQPPPEGADVKVTSRSGGQDALLLEEVTSSENGPVVPPLDLSGFDPNPPDVKSSPKKAASPKMSPPAATSLPSPKKTKPAGAAAKQAAAVKQTNGARTSAATKTAAAVKQTNGATTATKVAATKKVSPTSATSNKSTPTKTSPRSGTTPAMTSPRSATTPTAKTSPRSSTTPAKASPRPSTTTAPSTGNTAPKQSPRSAPPSKPSPRQPVKKAPGTKTKDGASDSGIEDEKTSPRKIPVLIRSPSGAPPKTPPPTTTPPFTAAPPPESPSLSNGNHSHSNPRSNQSIPTSTKTPPKKYGTDSVANLRHKPGGGNVKIFSEKVTIKNVGPKTDCKPSPRKAVASPKSPRSPIPRGSPSPNTRHVTSKIGSTANLRHTPGGGNVKITHQKPDLSHVRSKCGTMENVKHTPRGGDKKIESKKLEWKAESKIGSKDNIKHKAGGGDKAIETVKLEWKAESKVGSKDNIKHKAGGGDKAIETHKVDFREKAESKVGSKDNIKHKAGGGDKTIETVRLDFRGKAQARTDTGFVSGAGSQYTGSDRGGSPVNVPEDGEVSPGGNPEAPGGNTEGSPGGVEPTAAE